MVSSGSFNEPNDPGSEDADGSLGVSYAVGIEYKLKEFLYIGTETHIFAGTSGDQVRLHIIPPVGIFLIVKLN